VSDSRRRLALVGPIRVDDLRPWLDVDADVALPTGRGGTAVSQLAVGLLQRGVDLLVVSLDGSVSDELALDGPRLRLVMGPYRGHGQQRARDGFRVERAFVRDTLRREGVDLAHAHWTYEYALGSLASGVTTLITMRDWAPTMLRLSPDPYRVMRLAMHAATLARGRHFTVTSPYMQRKLRRWTGRRAPVIPNALEDEVFADPPVQGGGRSVAGGGVPGSVPGGVPWGVPGGPVLTALNHGFGRRKNLTTLLEAFALVREEVRSARLRLVGAGYAPWGPARRWALARGLESGVEFVGPVEHARVLGLLRDSDLFVHPSLEESFGMVVVEAMAQGVPVVAGARSGAVPWVLDGGRAGVLVDVSSPRALADGILGLLASAERREQLAVVGYQRAWDSYRVSAVVDRYLQVYEALRGGGRVPLSDAAVGGSP
jgi:glycosyltransferase involved in cell wall biosynthesis